MKTPEERQCFLMSPYQWDRSGGYSCTWICFNIYLSIIYFIWYMMRWTCVPPNITWSTKIIRHTTFSWTCSWDHRFLSTKNPNFSSPGFYFSGTGHSLASYCLGSLFHKRVSHLNRKTLSVEVWCRLALFLFNLFKVSHFYI